MSVQVGVNPIMALDVSVRAILLFLIVLVFVEFYTIYEPNRTPLLRGILYVVGTTGLSVAYYLVIAALQRDLYMVFLDWGVIAQAPRVLAMIYLLKVIRGGWTKGNRE